VGVVTGNPRMGILSLILLFGLGALLLWQVKAPQSDHNGARVCDPQQPG